MVAILLAGCHAEEIIQDGLQAGQPLRISASIQDYDEGSNTDIATRASVNAGVTTSFAVGDDMGVIGVRNGQLVYDNVRYVKQKTGAWEPVDASSDVVAPSVLYYPEMTYYAYAPYRTDYNGCKSIDDVKQAYTTLYNNGVFTDQSTAEKYWAADLLCSASSAVNALNKTVDFSFVHGMSLLKVFYNGEYKDLTIEKPVPHSSMYIREGTKTYRYIVLSHENMEVYGTAAAKTYYNKGQADETSFDSPAYWQTHINCKPGVSTYVNIACAPTESYKTSGVDMGFPSGCVWSNHNLGTQSLDVFNARDGKWYDEDGNVIDQNTASFDGLPLSKYHQMFDRGDYYSWGELHTKYEQPSIVVDESYVASDGKSRPIRATGDSYKDDTKTSVNALVPGSYKGYFQGTYKDNSYTYAKIDGNIAGSEHDVVRAELWKGEWRLPNEDEIDELMTSCDVSVVAWYYEDNVRYASWIGEKDDEGKYVNLHSQNSENWGTDDVRPYRYLVCIYKFVSKVNGAVLYFTGSSWTDWSIDMLCCCSRDSHGNISNPDEYLTRAAYGGLYYFASSASHRKPDCCSYMEVRNTKTRGADNKITSITALHVPNVTYTDKDGITHTLHGLTQDGHRYTGMQIRPVYGGKNWNTESSSKSSIWITVE